MGNIIRVQFGAKQPVKPAVKPKEVDKPRTPTAAEYRRYFYAFFDPKLNPHISKSYQGTNFNADLQAYIRTSLATVARSKVRPNTYNDRAALISNSNKEIVLGYLESFVAMKLDPLDVKAINILVHSENFIARAGQYIYEQREYYKIALKESDRVKEGIGNALSAAERERIEAHVKVCGPCNYHLEAMKSALSEYGSKDSPELKRRQAAIRERFFSATWSIKGMVEKFSRFELKDPIKILVTAKYLDDLFIFLVRRGKIRTKNHDVLIAYVLDPENDPLPTGDKVPYGE